MSGFAVFNAILLLTMATALFLALVSEALQNRFIASEPLLALGIGVLVGPFVLDWIRLEDLTKDIDPLLEQVARLTLSIAILTATLRVGWKWTRENFRDVLLILGIGMPLMWGLSWAVFSVTLNLALLPCLLMAAIVSPTDPVLAQSIVTSSVAQKWVPGRLRHFISIESAANDGLALLVVMIPILAMTEADHFGAGCSGSPCGRSAGLSSLAPFSAGWSDGA